MRIYGLISGEASWCARARARWPVAGQVALSESAVAFDADAARAGGGRGGLLLRSGPRGPEAALLYAHDGRYPSALARACAQALARGEGAAQTPDLGACSALSWRAGEVEARRSGCGLSPLWYAVAPQGEAAGVAVASHPWLLRALINQPCAVHRGALAAFLLGEDAGGDADFFAGLRRVQAGERLRWRAQGGGLMTQRRAAQVGQARGGDARAWAQALTETLQAQCARVEVPFAVALSGGIDSGLVAAACLGARPGERLRAVTMTSDRWPEMDERFATDQWAAHAPLEVRGCCVDGFGPLTAAPLLRQHADLGPQGHGGVAFLTGLAQAVAARGDRLLLTGLGGDQVFDLPLAAWLTSALWRGEGEALARRWRSGGLWAVYGAWVRPWLVGARWRWLRRALGGRALLRRAPHLARSPWRSARAWLTPEAVALAGRQGGEASGEEWMGWRGGWIWEDAVRHLSLCALASGVSFAHPLLDPPVLDVLARAPSALLMHPEPKALARRALRGVMPEPVRALPKVGGFDALMEQGIAAHAETTLQALFATPRLEGLGLLRRGELLDTLRRFVAWTRRRDTPRVGYAHLWRTIAAELWLQALSPPDRSPPWSPHDAPPDALNTPDLPHTEPRAHPAS